MQKIIMVGPDPRGVGGIETVLRSYLTLDSRKFEFIGLSTWDGTIENRDRWIFFKSIVWFMRNSNILRRDRAFIHVHLSHMGSFVREGIFVILSRLVFLRVFVTVHGSAFNNTSEKSRFLRALYGFILRTSCRTAVLNSASLATVTEMGVNSVMILPNPGPIPVNAVVTPAGDIGPIALFAGAVGRRKGVDVLLSAWEHVLKVIPDAELVILGPVDDQSIADRAGVFWQGSAHPSRVWEALKGSRVAVLPSTAEAMPMFVIESMGCGRPMVVTDVGAMPNQVDGWGSVIGVGDDKALAEALLVYLSDPELSTRHGAIAYSRYQKFFGSNQVESNLEYFYEGANLVID